MIFGCLPEKNIKMYPEKFSLEIIVSLFQQLRIILGTKWKIIKDGEITYMEPKDPSTNERKLWKKFVAVIAARPCKYMEFHNKITMSSLEFTWTTVHSW